MALLLLLLAASLGNEAWYSSCAQEAFRLASLQISFEEDLSWTVELQPASSFSDPAVLASTESTPRYVAHTVFNADKDYYFGLDGDCPSDEYDLVTAMLHELVHGLGMQYHIAGDALMSPVLDEGHAQHCVPCEVLLDLEKIGWQALNNCTCSSAGQIYPLFLLLLSALVSFLII